MIKTPGIVALLGSGETSAAGGVVFEAVVRRLESRPYFGILETPAGFELNSLRVAGRVAEYLNTRLHNFQPQIHLIPARKRNTAFSPDDPEICEGILSSNIIFLGPGSPTYTVRQLSGSLAWNYVQAKHRFGSSLTLASAATIALGCKALPVYEIYKVGEDPHWKPGLNFFAPFGLSLVIIPHWNNSEGGTEVDTSRCFVGSQRFDLLMAQLDKNVTVIGLDEHSGLIIDMAGEVCQVLGKGEVHLVKDRVMQSFSKDAYFPINLLGDYHPLVEISAGIEPSDWEKVITAIRAHESTAPDALPPVEVMEMLELRRIARLKKEWRTSDELRDRILNTGWVVVDSTDGQKLQRPGI